MGIVIDHGGGIASGLQHPIHDPAHAPAPGDDDRIFLLDRVRLALVARAIGMGDDLVVEDEQQRREQHGQRHNQQHQIG